MEWIDWNSQGKQSRIEVSFGLQVKYLQQDSIFHHRTPRTGQNNNKIPFDTQALDSLETKEQQFQLNVLQVRPNFHLYPIHMICQFSKEIYKEYILTVEHKPLLIHSKLKTELAKKLNAINEGLIGIHFVLDIQNGAIYIRVNPLFTSSIQIQNKYFIFMQKNVLALATKHIDSIIEFTELTYLQKRVKHSDSLFGQLRRLLPRICDQQLPGDEQQKFLRFCDSILQNLDAVEFHKKMAQFYEYNLNVKQTKWPMSQDYASEKSLSYIHIFKPNINQWEQIYSGQTITHSQLEVEFMNVENLSSWTRKIEQPDQLITNSQPHMVFRETLLMKCPLKGCESKIRRQKSVLNKMKGLRSPYICEYYESMQNQFENCVFTPLYMPLQKYLKQFTTVMSIHTKLQMLIHVLRALQFLRQHSIVHTGLKSTNVMVSHNRTFKLSDFSNAYHPSLFNQDNDMVVLSSNSPEIMQFMPVFTSKIDVFDFGVLMLEIFFKENPLSTLPIRSVRQPYRRPSFDLSNINPERMCMMGRQDIMEIVFVIALRCLNKNPMHRPELDWMIIIFEQATRILEKTF